MFVLNKYLELEEIKEIRQFFINAGTPKECRKNEFFVQRGQKQDYAGFILKGGFRYLGYTSDGEEQIVGYSFENDFVVDYGSFQMQKPAVIGGQAVKNSTVLILSHKEINTFYDKYSALNFRSKVAETCLEDVYGRMLSLYCDSPEGRYIKLIERYPDILNLVSLKEIASLIKIAPETLSRIRRKLSLNRIP